MLALKVLQCLHHLGVPKLGIKWPNDIYCDQRKLSGLLIECSGEISNACKLVVGLGVNVSMSHVKHVHIDQQWTDIISHVEDWSLTRNELAARLMTSLAESLILFENNEMKNIVSEWAAWDTMLNRRVQISSLKDEQSGIARGIDESGCLLLETKRGVEKISAGDVTLRMHE